LEMVLWLLHQKNISVTKRMLLSEKKNNAIKIPQGVSRLYLITDGIKIYIEKRLMLYCGCKSKRIE
ncbi:MAG: hypothetical protein V1859_08380, partial [archaeon]